MINILICDSNEKIINYLKKQIEDCGLDMIGEVYAFRNTERLLSFVEHQFDSQYIIMLNVNISIERGGIIIGRFLNEMGITQIVFFTDSNSYIEDVYEAEHMFYLKLPCSKENLCKAVMTAEKRIKSNNETYYLIQKRNSVRRIPKHKIIFLETKNRNVEIICDDCIEFSRSRLDDVINELGNCFIRCHMSYAVNMERVECITGNEIHLQNGKIIPISRRYSRIIRDAFLDYLNSKK